MEEDRLNLFGKTTYSYSEEDRVTNALLIVLQHTQFSVLSMFLKMIGIASEIKESILIRDHIHYDEHNIVDGEIALAGDFVVAIESKIYQGKFEEDNQAVRYLDLLIEKDEQEKILLLISPDVEQPKLVEYLSSSSQHVHIKWLSWGHILKFLDEVIISIDAQIIDTYLISEFKQYIEFMGLVDRENQEDKKERLRSQLQAILGNQTAEKVLLHIYHYKSSYASQIARDHGIYVYSVQKQLNRFEQGGILYKERHGRTVLYFFNHRNPFFKPLQQLIRNVYDSISLEEKLKIFSPKYMRRSK
jgi:DNA-binding MarR family transcriptional regulator